MRRRSEKGTSGVARSEDRGRGRAARADARVRGGDGAACLKAEARLVVVAARGTHSAEKRRDVSGLSSSALFPRPQGRPMGLTRMAGFFVTPEEGSGRARHTERRLERARRTLSPRVSSSVPPRLAVAVAPSRSARPSTRRHIPRLSARDKKKVQASLFPRVRGLHPSSATAEVRGAARPLPSPRRFALHHPHSPPAAVDMPSALPLVMTATRAVADAVHAARGAPKPHPRAPAP